MSLRITGALEGGGSVTVRIPMIKYLPSFFPGAAELGPRFQAASDLRALTCPIAGNHTSLGFQRIVR